MRHQAGDLGSVSDPAMVLVSCVLTYATSDPDGAYTSPGIEASVRPSARTSGLINCRGHDYVTIENIDATQSNSFGLYFKSPGNYLTARGCEVSHSLDGGIVALVGKPVPEPHHVRELHQPPQQRRLQGRRPACLPSKV
jgi:hypothetical protein